jgi:hypothetical protein
MRRCVRAAMLVVGWTLLTITLVGAAEILHEGFETPPFGWTTDNGVGLSQDTTFHFAGNASGLVTHSDTVSRGIKIGVPNATHYFSVRYRTTNPDVRNIFIRIQSQNSSDCFGGFIIGGGGAAVPANSDGQWHQITGSVTPDANSPDCTQFTVRYSGFTAVGKAVNFDEIILQDTPITPDAEPNTLTPTVTATATATGTSTATATATGTSTASATATATPTRTATHTFTQTATVTHTFTPTATFTVTQTPTRTHTATPFASQVVATPGSCVSVTGSNSGTAWSNPDGAKSVDANFAQVSPVGISSENLQCTGFGFPDLPPDAQIIGIEVLALRQANADFRARDSTVQLLKDAVAVAATRGGNVIYQSLEEQPYGSITDTWGESWTTTELQDPDFGVLYSVRRTNVNPVLISVDALRVRVSYFPGLTPTVTPTGGATRTVTRTVTRTATASVTLTGSPTHTASPSVTFTANPSSTVSPGSTATASPAAGGVQSVLVPAGSCDQADYGSGTAPWADPNNAQSQNGLFATTDLSLSPTNHFASEYLRCSGYDLSVIPAGATITGIEVLVLRQEAGPTLNVAREASLKLLKGLTPVPTGTDQAAANGQPFIPTSLTERTYGSSSNLWSTTWTRAELQSGTGFGVVYAVRRSGSSYPASVRVDALRVRISYTTP